MTIDDPLYEEARDAYLVNLEALIAQHGWACQGVFGDGGAFTYTVGLTAKGWPELFIDGIDPNQATMILNAIAQHAVDHGGFSIDEPVDVEWSVKFRLRGPVDVDAAEAFVARRLYGDGVRVLQVLFPDAAGRYPDEERYDSIALPQRLIPAWPEHLRGRFGLMDNDNQTPAEPDTVSVTETVQTQTEVPATTEIAVETPAKNIESTTVAATAETAGGVQPDAATQAMAVEDNTSEGDSSE